MIEGVPAFAIYVPGADEAQNASRRLSVRAVTQHRTEGDDSRALGARRHHNTPGTFNFLNRDDGLYCYYPAWVRCSHAAGANHAGPGVENEGYTGKPLSAKQIHNLGLLAHWFHDTYGVPLSLYDEKRIEIDHSTFTGHVNHNSVLTTPVLEHFDRITPAEFASAIGSPLDSGDPDMFIAIEIPAPHRATLVGPYGRGHDFTGPVGAFGVRPDMRPYIAAKVSSVGVSTAEFDALPLLPKIP